MFPVAPSRGSKNFRFFALTTLFSLGMLRVDGWAHDVWRSNGMLYTEALFGLGALVLFVAIARQVRGMELPGAAGGASTLR